MPNDPFEDRLRDRLAGHPTPVNTDQIWAAVEPRLPAPARRVLWPWFAALGVLLLAGALALTANYGDPAAEEAPARTTPVVSTQPVFGQPVAGAAQLATAAPDAAPAPAPPVRRAGAGPRLTGASPAPPAELPPVRTDAPRPAATRTLVAVRSVTPAALRPVVSTAPASAPYAAGVRRRVREVRRGVLLERRRTRRLQQRKRAHWSVTPAVAASLISTPQPALQPADTPLEAVTAETLVGYHRPGGLSLRTGVSLTRINTRADATTEIEETVTQRGVINRVLQPDGTFTDEFGDVEVPTTRTIVGRYYNTLTSVDLPVLVGYRFGTRRWAATAEFGPSLNLAAGGQATLPTDGGTFRSVAPGFFRSRLRGSGFRLGLGTDFRLGAGGRLTLALQARTFGSGFEDPAVAGYSRRLRLAGVNLGYRVRL